PNGIVLARFGHLCASKHRQSITRRVRA
ncbi:hypothetical protein D046_0929B, partial [Vibrio parahaemolyticus V-223/04]